MRPRSSTNEPSSSPNVVTCENCSNRFECPLVSFSLDDRKAACLKLSRPDQHSPKVSLVRDRLIIPEDPHTWERRLLKFQVCGDWVRQGERIVRIDSLADWLQYKICDASNYLGIISEMYGEEAN